MTVLDDRPLLDWPAVEERPEYFDDRLGRPRTRSGHGQFHRPAPSRPAVAPLSYRSGGVAMSRARHDRPVSAATTGVLAATAALITLWLGSLAHSRGDRVVAPVSLPEQLAVVQVQAGETLQQLAGRVAPDASAGKIVERIRDLNHLGSAAVSAGQTLIAPVG